MSSTFFLKAASTILLQTSPSQHSVPSPSLFLSWLTKEFGSEEHLEVDLQMCRAGSAAVAVPAKARSKSCLSVLIKPLRQSSWVSVMVTLSSEVNWKQTMQLQRGGQGSVLLLHVSLQGWGLQLLQLYGCCLRREGLVHQPHCPCCCCFHLAWLNNRLYSILEFLS